MNTYISMLRGINVSGQKMINMIKLKEMYESLGFKNVRTYIQSGYVVFQSPAAEVSELKGKIEEGIKRAFEFDVPVFIRTGDDFQKLIKKNPFSKNDIPRRYVTFLSDAPQHIPLDEIERVKDKSEEFLISGKEIYLFLPNGSGTTKLSNTFFEKKLRVGATTRNWNTVVTLFEMSGDKGK